MLLSGCARAMRRARGHSAQGEDGTGQGKWRGGGARGRCAVLPVAQRVGARRKKEERRMREKNKREKEKRKRKRKKRKKWRERERELSAGFAAAVDARARWLQSETTRTRNEEKGNTRTGIEFGCRNDGSSEKDFGESVARTGKNLE